MAIFRPGGVVGDVSGRLGGTVFARAGGSSVVRAAGRRTGVVSDFAAVERASLVRCGEVWAASSESSRRSWDVLASKRTYVNRLGVARQITGRALFIKWAMSVMQGDPAVDSIAPALGQMFAPQFFAVYYLEGGPVAVSAWGYPLGSADLLEQLFFQRGRGVMQTRGFGRMRRVYAGARLVAAVDRYAELAAAGLDLLDGERFAAGLSWYYEAGFMGARAQCVGTVGNVPWEVDDFDRSSLGPYVGDTSFFRTEYSTVKVGYGALEASLPSGPVAAKLINSYSGLPLYPVRGQQFEFWTRSDAGNRITDTHFGKQDGNNYYILRWGATLPLIPYRVVGGVATQLASSIAGVQGADVWSRVVLDWGTSGAMRLRGYSSGGTLLGTANFADSTFDNGGIGFYASNLASNSTLAYWDGVQVTGASEV